MIRGLSLAIAAFLFLTGPVLASDTPDQIGPWIVGHTQLEAVDPNRDDRPLPLEVWYPVDPNDALGDPNFTFYVLLPPPLNSGITSTVSFEDVPVSSAGLRPLIVFSHGSGGIPIQSIKLCETLASHGFIVVAPAHTGNTTNDSSTPFAQAAIDRAHDGPFVIDFMIEKAATPGDPFEGRINSMNVGVIGHSFGGWTAVAMVAGFGEIPPDPRVQAIMPVAGSAQNLTNSGIASISVPILALVGTLDSLQPTSRRVHELVENAPYRARVDVIGANHTHFANVCDIAQALIDAGLPPEVWELVGAGQLIPIYEATCIPPAFPIEEATRLQNLYAVSLFRRYLLGETFYDAFLSKPYADANEPDVVFFDEPEMNDETKEQQGCINELNKGLEQVSKAQAKDIAKCIKDGAMGKLPQGQTIEDCVLADTKGKIAKARQKMATKAADGCTAPLPDFGPTDPNSVGEAAVGKELAMIHDIFGSDLDQAIADFSVNKIQSPLLLEGCMGEDPKGKITKSCNTKLADAIGKKCGGLIPDDPNQPIFAGCLDEELETCLNRIVRCRVCRGLNQADALAQHCDEFDEGVVNSSCY
jgi:predicted dienelactone hydrolase